MELAIDTSTGWAGIALAQRGKVLSEMTWRAEFNHTVQLMPAIESLLRQAGLKPKDLEAIGVAIGPGSFSGLRVGLAAAKGFAMSLGVPLAGVSTLLLEAYPFLAPGLPVRPVLDAGRGEVSTASFQQSRATLEDSGPPCLMSVEALCADVHQSTIFCGEHLPALREHLAAALGDLAHFPAESALARRPGNLAELAWKRLARGEADDASTLQPVYLRDPSISRSKVAAPAVKK